MRILVYAICKNESAFVRRWMASMSEADGARAFVRQYTLPSGGPYCDCGYEKKKQVKVSGGSAL